VAAGGAARLRPWATTAFATDTCWRKGEGLPDRHDQSGCGNGHFGTQAFRAPIDCGAISFLPLADVVGSSMLRDPSLADSFLVRAPPKRSVQACWPGLRSRRYGVLAQAEP